MKTGKGVISYISNFSYLSDPSFVVMRTLLLKEFDEIWIDCLNGDSRETGKRTPDGEPDPSAFSTENSKVGIRVGTSISIFVRGTDQKPKKKVKYRDYWGVDKRRDLMQSLESKHFEKPYANATPSGANRYSFRPEIVSGQYREWPRVIDLCAIPPSNGLMEKRGGALIDIDREALEKRMSRYYDQDIEWEQLKIERHQLTIDAARFDAKTTREKVFEAEEFEIARIVRYAVRPFDYRWCYYTSLRPIWNEPRPSYRAQCWEGNSFFMTRFRSSASPEGAPCYVVDGLSDDHFIMPDNACFPIQYKELQLSGSKVSHKQSGFSLDDQKPNSVKANLSQPSRAYLTTLGIKDFDSSHTSAEIIWMHALAIGYSPRYLADNADGIRQDWPRIPLPGSRELLLKSAELGRQIASLLNTEQPVKGVNSGKVDERVRTIGSLRRIDSKSIDPHEGDLELTAGWGHRGKDSVCMPGQGNVRQFAAKDLQQVELFGRESIDVYLNSNVYWSNIPMAVWKYYIGGYQVIKKWLSYREKSILGRSLTLAEAEYVTEMIRRIALLVLMQPDLDANYLSIAENSRLLKTPEKEG